VLDLSPPFLPPFTGYRLPARAPRPRAFFCLLAFRRTRGRKKKKTAKMKKKGGRDRKERPATSDQQQNPKGD
jgi:hypothetical protein